MRPRSFHKPFPKHVLLISLVLLIIFKAEVL